MSFWSISKIYHTAPSQRATCSGQNRQYHRGGIYQQTGGAALTSSSYIGTQTDSVEQFSPVIPQGDTCAGHTELGSRFALQGQPFLQGLETPGRGDNADMEKIRPGSGRSLRVRRKCTVPNVLLPDRPERCYSARVATGSTVRFSPIRADHTYSGQSAGQGSCLNSYSAPLVGKILASGDIPAVVRSAVASASTEGSPVAGARGDFSPSSRAHGAMGLARERLNLTTAGLPQSVIKTTQSARAPSTRIVYDGKWRAFQDWCAKADVEAFQSPTSGIFTFLQELLDKGLAFSTVKVYLAAISACHIGIGGKTAGQHPLVCQFMKGAWRMRPVSRSLTPPWDLTLVLEALSCAPFEPLQQVELKMLSCKTALLLALTSAKHVSDIHTLSLNPACMRFFRGDLNVFLKPREKPEKILRLCLRFLTRLPLFKTPPGGLPGLSRNRV